MTTPRAILKPRRAQPFFGQHPWVYGGAIASIQGEPANGDEVDLYSHAGNFIARGLYNAESKIRVRLYRFNSPGPLDRDFFRQRLTDAVRLRRDILGLIQPESACRLVFSEADNLSGMVVDRFGEWLVVQFTALGLAQRRQELAELLVEQVHPKGIYLRTEKGIGKLEGLELQDGLLWGEPPPPDLTIDEAGLRLAVNLAEGQKTGFYLDQRENRQFVAGFARGRRVLDAFCYSGGFGLHAARAGAESVLCVDSSAAAIQLAESNARRNGLTQVKCERADVFEHLQKLQSAGQRFGLVVLDPPKFARARSAVPEALRGYRRLITVGLRLLEHDGLLVMCCCSGLVTMDMLDELFGQISAEEKRAVQLLARRGPAADHPVSAHCLETGYLKCIVARVL